MDSASPLEGIAVIVTESIYAKQQLNFNSISTMVELGARAHEKFNKS